MIELTPYQPRSFLTHLGSLAAMRRLKARGFPGLRNWRFVTLTIDREAYPNPEEAYDVGCRHLRQFVYSLRESGYSIKRWCWKMEFHSPDERTGEIYPHWHLLLEYHRPIPCELIASLWGKGRTEIRGVRDAGFNYLFKYLGKGLDGLPDWILTRYRVRFFQTSKGFFPADCVARDIERPSPRQGADPSDTDTENDRFGCQAENIGERLKRWARSVVSRSEDERGVRHRLHIGLTESWGELLVRAAQTQFALGWGKRELVVTTNKIQASCHRYLPPSLLLYQRASM